MTKEEMMKKYSDLNGWCNETGMFLNDVAKSAGCLIGYLKSHIDNRQYQWALQFIYEIVFAIDNYFAFDYLSSVRASELYGKDAHDKGICTEELDKMLQPVQDAAHSLGAILCLIHADTKDCKWGRGGWSEWEVKEEVENNLKILNQK